MKSNATFRFLIVAAILIVYIALRFWHLTGSCLWFDEIFSIHAAEMSFPELFRFVAANRRKLGVGNLTPGFQVGCAHESQSDNSDAHIHALS